MGKFDTAKPTEYNGTLYDSKHEATCAQELDFRVAARELTHWESQVRIPLIVNGYEVAVYVIDFVAYRTDGKMELIEAKGTAGDTKEWRLKWRMLMALCGENEKIKMVILWQKPVVRGVKNGKLVYQGIGAIKKSSLGAVDNWLLTKKR